MKKLLVIFGGQSSEHDISIITGIQLCKNILPYYNLEKIYMGLDNRFYLATKVDEVSFFNNKNSLNLKEVFFFNGALYQKGIFNKKICDIDCVVNCCHGGFGENGDLVSYFSVLGIKCTSANTMSAKIAMDKSLAKELLKNVVKTINGTKVTKQNFDKAVEEIELNFSNDLIVKPNSLGSSIGVKACTKQNYKEQIEAIFEMGDDALVEERVVNIKEYNQACYKTDEGLCLSAIEQPLTKSDFLTFDDKYNSNSKGKGSDRIIPADISPELENEIIENTSKIYTALNMNGMVRIDYIFDEETQTLYFNEVNTVPGSMAFYLYEPIGIDYITLIEQIVENTPEIKKFTYFDTQILNNKKI